MASRLPVLLAALAALLLPAGQTLAAPLDTRLDPDWKLVSDRNDIQVFVRHTDQSRLKTFRGVTRFVLPDEYALAAVFNDYPSLPKWLYMVDSATELKRDGPLRRYLHITTDLPWPLDDRDTVIDVSVRQRITTQEETIIIGMENRPGLLPVQEGYVRIPEMRGMFKFRRIGNAGLIEATYEVVLDPGGYVPGWVVNILARDIPYFTLDRLRRFVLRDEYQGLFLDYLELRGSKRPATLMPPRSYLYGFPPERAFEDVPPERINELKRAP
ncbi:MAG: START domain-containing protein [Pseudomonadota bacterium]